MSSNSHTKTSVRLHEYNLTSRLSSFYASKLEPKIARSFTDDADVRYRRNSVLCRQFRPGQRDDEISCAYGTMLGVS